MARRPADGGWQRRSCRARVSCGSAGVTHTQSKSSASRHTNPDLHVFGPYVSRAGLLRFACLLVAVSAPAARGRWHAHVVVRIVPAHCPARSPRAIRSPALHVSGPNGHRRQARRGSRPVDSSCRVSARSATGPRRRSRMSVTPARRSPAGSEPGTSSRSLTGAVVLGRVYALQADGDAVRRRAGCAVAFADLESMRIRNEGTALVAASYAKCWRTSWIEHRVGGDACVPRCPCGGTPRV